MVIISTVLILAGFLGSANGLVSLFSPAMARVSSRWFALPLLFSLLGMGGLAMILSPDEKLQSANEIRIAGSFLFSIWMILFWLARTLAKPRTLESVRSVNWLSAARFRRALEQLLHSFQAEFAEQEAERRRKQEKKREKQEEPVGASPRSATQYVTESTQYIPTSTRKDRRRNPVVDFDPLAPRYGSGRLARFIYVDSEGEVTEREIANWHSDDEYLSGFCLYRRATRKFRLDRIETWISG